MGPGGGGAPREDAQTHAQALQYKPAREAWAAVVFGGDDNVCFSLRRSHCQIVSAAYVATHLTLTAIVDQGGIEWVMLSPVQNIQNVFHRSQGIIGKIGMSDPHHQSTSQNGTFASPVRQIDWPILLTPWIHVVIVLVIFPMRLTIIFGCPQPMTDAKSSTGFKKDDINISEGKNRAWLNH